MMLDRVFLDFYRMGEAPMIYVLLEKPPSDFYVVGKAFGSDSVKVSETDFVSLRKSGGSSVCIYTEDSLVLEI